MDCHQTVRDLAVTKGSIPRSRRRGARVVLLGVFIALLAACDAGGTPGTKNAASALGSPILATELVERISAGNAPLILDVRTPREYEAGHVPGAVLIPHRQLKARLAELPADPASEIIVYCKAGTRARMVEADLIAAGYQNVRDLDGHWDGWSAAGLPGE
jgi:rhodanese-related sulfurtransferase